MLGNGLPGFQINLHRAYDPLLVAGMQARGRRGVYNPQLFQHCLDSLFSGKLFQLFAPSGAGVGGKIIALDERVHIKPCTTGNNGGFAPTENILHNGMGHLAVAADGKILCWFCHGKHVVGDSLHFLCGRLGSADIHFFINLHRVAGDDFTVHCLSKLYRKCCFTGGGRACNTNDVVHIFPDPGTQQIKSTAAELLFNLFFA